MAPSASSELFFAALASQIFQNLRFSSPAPVATVVPSGLRLLHSTRVSCAGTSYIFSRDGYDQSEIVLSGNPWVERSSFECGDHIKDVTWDVVQSVLVRAPVVEDQK